MKEKCHLLIIDDSFKRMCAPLPEKEYEELSSFIRNNGCSYPIQVWKKHILTDFAVYDICHKYNIPFQIETLSFTSKDDAIFYAALELVKNPNIPTIYYRYIVGVTYFAVKNILHDVSKGNRRNPFPQHLFDTKDEAIIRNKSSIVTANAFGITTASTLDYSRFSNAMDRLYIKAPHIAKEIMKHTFLFGMKQIIVLSRMPIDVIPVAYNRVKNDPTYSLLQNTEYSAKTTKQVSLSFKTRASYVQSSPEIKKMPKYDPDAELSSLSYTIPSWISSINRTLSVADFENSSMEAQHKLSKALNDLVNTTLHLKYKLEEKPTNE